MNLWLPGGGGGRWQKGIDRELELDMYTLLYLKRITNKDLLYSTGNSDQCYVAAWMEENGNMYMYGYLLCSETITILLTVYTSI